MGWRNQYIEQKRLVVALFLCTQLNFVFSSYKEKGKTLPSSFTMSVLTLEAKLERLDPNTPWGFRMQGGKDFHSALMIQKVTSGSLAAKCGLQSGDIILKIGKLVAETLKHKEAQDAILSYGNKLDLLLQRSSSQGVLDINKLNINSTAAAPPSPIPSPIPKPASPVPSKPVTPPPPPPPPPPALPASSGSGPSSNFNAVARPFPAGQHSGFSHGSGAPVASYTPPPAAPAPPPPQVQLFSLPKQAAHTPRAPPPPPAPAIVPKAPPPPPVHRPQAVTKPKLPSGPPKPTGQGATKGKKGDAVYKNPDQSGRIPVCAACGTPIRGPFVLAMGKSWCPAHFVCANPNCGVKLFDIGFVEEGGFLYCEKDYELYFAPHCHKCNQVIIGECVNAMNTTFHPNCFLCAQCRKPIGGSSFHIEDGEFYCDPHWKEMFQAICFGCKYPIDPGDRWVEAMDHSYHSDCFVCTTCQVSLEGQPFYAKTGKPYCKKHAR
ncbi:domain-binding 3-like isoform X7 [Octopus vulgaris]|uniref:Domain-binding 3-like isoform X7 n=2 Tax=Octopus vulgaris TaxID=6645 RepID=A0AA36F556_OCTVU|nr:domain-binding 3-like isoform X7 [Octopus vulgaris]